MKRFIALLLLPLIMFTVVAVALPAPAFAAVNDSCHQSRSFFGFPTWYEYLDIGPKGDDECAIVGPNDGLNNFSWEKALPRIMLALIDIMLRLVGIVATGFLVYSGFLFLTAQGNPDSAKKARSAAINALIGIAIAILATSVVSFVGDNLWK